MRLAQAPVVDAVVLCALALETDAILDRLTIVGDVWTSPAGDAYWIAEAPHVQGGAVRVAIRQVGAGNVGTAAATEAAIRDLRPSAAFFVGVAGGVKDVRIGDVVLGTKVHDVLAGKETEQSGFTARPDQYRASPLLLDLGRQARRALLEQGDERFSVLEGPIAGGNRVVAADADTLGVIAAHYSDTIAVEMEGFGFYLATQRHPSVHGLVIRGISDLVLGKADADAAGSQPRAATHAAEVAVRIIRLLPRRPDAGYVQPSAPQPWSAISVPPSAGRLIGREVVIAEVRDRLQRERTVVISGVAGVGKTAVAAEVATAVELPLVWWVPSASAEAAHDALWRLGVELADRGVHSGDPADAPLMVRAARRWLSTSDEWLVVLDDCAGPQTVTDILPFLARGRVLVTSTNGAWPGTAVITLDPLSPADAVAVLADRTGAVSPAHADIAEALAGLPLALVQASGYIVETAMDAEEYAAHLRESLATLLDASAPPDHPSSVIATLDLLLTAVAAQSPAAVEMALLMSYLAPSPLPLRAWGFYFELNPLPGDKPRQLQLRDLLSLLARSGLLRLTPESSTLHPLAGAVVRAWLAEDPTAVRHARNAATVALGASREAQTTESLLLANSVIPHLLAAAESLTSVSTPGEFSSEHWLNSLVWGEVARLYRMTHRYSSTVDAARVARTGMQPWLEQFSIADTGCAVADDASWAEEHYGVARWQAHDLLVDLDSIEGVALADLGRVPEAVPLLERALRLTEFAGVLEDVARASNNLGLAYARDEDFHSALPLARRALRLDEMWGAPAGLLARRHVHVGQALHELGDHVAALEHYQAADAMYEGEGLSIGDPTRSHVQTLLATARAAQSTDAIMDDDAIVQRLRVDVERAVADGDDRQFAITSNNLALALGKRGSHDDAQAQMELSLSAAEKLWGRTHRETVTRLANAAVLATEAGNLTVAEAKISDAAERATGASGKLRGTVEFVRLRVAMASGRSERIAAAAAGLRAVDLELEDDPQWALHRKAVDQALAAAEAAVAKRTDRGRELTP